MISQSERETTKDHHGAVDKNLNQNNISVVASILFIVRKNWAHAPTTSGPYGRLAGRRNVREFQSF